MGDGVLFVVGVALMLLAIVVHAVLIAPTRLRLRTIDAPITGLAQAFDGYRIAVLTDLHYGSTIFPARHLARAVALARGTSPDLIALLGDYSFSHHRAPRLSESMYRWAMPRVGAGLGRLTAPDGMVAVLGNHDHDFDAGAVSTWLGTLGARVLTNDCVVIRRGDAGLAIGGVADWSYGEVDPSGGCAGLPPAVPRIVLSHNPDAVFALAPEARIDLVLAGHTHGGQVVLPFIGAPKRHSRICGRHTASGWIPAPVPLFVSTGTGALVPLRVGTRPEVLLVRLRSRAETDEQRRAGAG